MVFAASVVQILLLFASACLLGRPLIKYFAAFSGPVLRTAAEAGLGLLFISHLIFILVSFQLVSSPVLWALTGIFSAAGIYEIFRRFKSREWSLTLNFETALLIVYFSWIVLNAFLPVSDRDEMIYHLQIPKMILKNGGLVFFQDNIYAYFPQLGEMLMLLGLGTWGETAARLTHLLFGGLLAAVLYGFTLEKINRAAARTAVFLFLAVPSVMAVFPLAYTDLSYSFYAFLALIGVLRFLDLKNNFDLVPAGIFLGAACCVKFTGIQYALLIAAMIIGAQLALRRAGGLKPAGLLLFTALFWLLPYLARNYGFTGWPLFPFPLGKFILHPNLNWDPERARLYVGWLGNYGNFSTPLVSFLLSPVLVFLRGQFNEPLFYDGVLSPLFLTIPFFWKKNFPGFVRFLGIFSLLLLFQWSANSRQIRFLIPALPVFCFLWVYGWQQTSSNIRRAAFGIAVVSMLWGTWAGARFLLQHDPVPFWTGKESREDYLRRNVPQYGIYQEANHKLTDKDNLYLINMRNYGYYLEPAWRGDFVFERYELNRDFEPKPSADLLKDFFGKREVTHLLIDRGFISQPEIGFPVEAMRVFEAYLKENASLLAQDGPYVLYQLKK